MEVVTRVTIETALNEVGFGLYSYMLVLLTGMIIISFSCVVYSNTVLIPISSCELKTNTMQQGLLAAMPSVGAIVGGIFWGYLGDTRGRRSMLLLSLLLGAIVNAISCLSINWFILLIIQLIASILVSGQYPLSMTLLSECVPMGKRNLVLILVTSIFLFSQGIMAVIAMPLVALTFSHYMPGLGIYWTPWRAVALIYSVPSLVCFIWLYFMHESPKHEFENDEEVRALEILNGIHKVNHLMSRTTFEVTGLVHTVEEPKGVTALDEPIMDKIKPFFKKPLREKIIIITVLYMFQFMWPFKVWLPTMANQFMSIVEAGGDSDLTLCRIIDLSLKNPTEYACSLNTTALSLVLVVCAVQSVANLLLSPFIDYVGRRNMVILITTVCGISGIFVNIIPHTITSAILFAIQLIGMICMGYYTAIAVSLFPTPVRAMGVTIAVTGNRVSMFVSVQILNYLLQNYCEVGFFLFSSLFTISSMIASFLPDERNSALRRRSHRQLQIPLDN